MNDKGFVGDLDVAQNTGYSRSEISKLDSVYVVFIQIKQIKSQLLERYIC